MISEHFVADTPSTESIYIYDLIKVNDKRECILVPIIWHQKRIVLNDLKDFLDSWTA